MTMDQKSLSETDHLLTATRIRSLANQLNIHPTKKLGQNFMIDPGTVRRIVSLAAVNDCDQILEVGPGLGSLTLGLLETGASVTAIEIDPSLAQQLPRTVQLLQPDHRSNFHLVLADALRITPDNLQQSGLDLSRPFKLVANLPYNVAVPIFLTLLQKCPTLQFATVLVQDEVADRLSAQPGSKMYGVPSVKLAWYGKAVKAGKVGRSVFWPSPNVDSALVSFQRYDAPLDTDGCRDLTFQLIDEAFSQRRKTLRASLKKSISADQIEAAGYDSSLRGEKLTVNDFMNLAHEIINSK
ncbi:MAG: 16S rRNA (adenine(1518)-N(6)/adenine(1519)-N(6))-dimethyltransferase RsmA [Aeriscardovia sp.]|nr:16S rRNA (adenine(1518)-N(6)/adenine(1519)-N(6))-dimethyltransferase RsmA [Aeriscardovia sp.]